MGTKWYRHPKVSGPDKTFIYSLACPSTGEIKYIGRSSGLKKRLDRHLEARDSARKSRWINELKDKGLRPVIEVVDEVLVGEWEYWEKYYIAQFKAWGFYLTNETEGGIGPKGYSHSEKTKAIIKEKRKNQGCSEETRRKMSLAHKGKKNSTEAIAKQIATARANGSYSVSEETRKKISKTLTGKKQSLETIEKRRKAIAVTISLRKFNQIKLNKHGGNS